MEKYKDFCDLNNIFSCLELFFLVKNLCLFFVYAVVILCKNNYTLYNVKTTIQFYIKAKSYFYFFKKILRENL